MNRASASLAACVAVLALGMSVSADGDDLGGLPGDDFSEELAADPIDWRPVITHFYVQSSSPGADPARLHFETPAGGLPGLVNAWEDLKPHVRWRDEVWFGQSYPDGEPVISAWRALEDGTGFEIHAGVVVPPPASEDGTETGARASAEQRPIRALLSAQKFTIFVGVDVLMNFEDPETQDNILRFFTLDRFRLSIHEIDAGIEKFRGVPNKESVSNGQTGLDSEFWLEVRDRVNGFEWSPDLRVGGAYAIRVEAAVSGRVDDSEDFGPPKEVEGEIRIVLVDQATKTDQLSFEETGDTDIFD